MIIATNMAAALAKAAEQCKVDHNVQHAWVKRHVTDNLSKPGGPGVKVVRDNVKLSFKTAQKLGLAV